jgi:hypothetical protein
LNNNVGATGRGRTLSNAFAGLVYTRVYGESASLDGSVDEQSVVDVCVHTSMAN